MFVCLIYALNPDTLVVSACMSPVLIEEKQKRRLGEV